jgi:hypothetical protein
MRRSLPADINTIGYTDVELTTVYERNTVDHTMDYILHVIMENKCPFESKYCLICFLFNMYKSEEMLRLKLLKISY